MRHEDDAPRDRAEPVTTLDDRLAARLRTGDPDAMADVYDRYADRIYNFCFRRTASWSAAEDAMSAAFLEAWKVRRRATSYDGSLLPWLCTVAGNVCRKRPLSDQARVQRKAELMNAIEARQKARRWVVPTVAAAVVGVVSVGAAVGVVGDDETNGPAQPAGPHGTMSSSPDKAKSLQERADK